MQHKDSDELEDTCSKCKRAKTNLIKCGRQGTQIRREVALIGTPVTRIPEEHLEPQTHELSASTQESSIWTYETFVHNK